jgi:comEA protein
MTHNEFVAIVVALTLLLVGQVARQFLMDRPVFDDEYYHERDSLFFALSSATAEPDTILVPRTDSAVVADSMYTERDSTHTEVESGGESQQDKRIDVNRASLVELTRLPGIGPRLAERIVEYRRRHGPFRKVSDLVNVAGIGPKKLESLAPLVVVRL